MQLRLPSPLFLNHYFANDLLICIWFNLKWFKSLIQWFKIIFFSFQQHLIHTQNYLVQKSWNIIMVVLVILLIFYSFIYNQTLTFKGFNVENEFHIFIQRKLTTYFKYKPWRKQWTHLNHSTKTMETTASVPVTDFYRKYY